MRDGDKDLETVRRVLAEAAGCNDNGDTHGGRTGDLDGAPGGGVAGPVRAPLGAASASQWGASLWGAGLWSALAGGLVFNGPVTLHLHLTDTPSRDRSDGLDSLRRRRGVLAALPPANFGG
ncbi:hypothetical protein JCM17960_33430 [Magnetospira thiophila]